MVKRVIRNYWRKGLDVYGAKVVVMPLGYAAGRSGANMPPAPTFAERSQVWAFAGSADRNGRDAALGNLRSVNPHNERTKQTWSAPNLLDGPGYIKMLRDAKFVPCFRGSRALESYRIYEALEHGAIPIYVPGESQSSADELRELYGAHPFLGFPSWAKAAEMLPLLANQPVVMEKHRQTLAAWWAAKKAELTLALR
jgi:hypothetical protein